MPLSSTSGPLYHERGKEHVIKKAVPFLSEQIPLVFTETGRNPVNLGLNHSWVVCASFLAHLTRFVKFRGGIDMRQIAPRQREISFMRLD
jgi:hypothetical protein